MSKKTTYWIFACFFIIIAICSYFDRKTYENAMKDSVLTSGKVIDILFVKGQFRVDVSYQYGNKNITNYFTTYNRDSWHTGTSIKILVSKKKPEDDIKFIGVVK